jgi:hypothetical protein
MKLMAAHTRSRDDDDRRVKTFTRWTLAGALAATVSFGGLAAAATHAHAAAPTDDSSSSSVTDSSSSSLTPSSSAPEQSFSPPVAQSGGS